MNKELEKEVKEIIAKKLLAFFNENDLLGILADNTKINSIKPLYNKQQGYLLNELPQIIHLVIEQQEDEITYNISKVIWETVPVVYKKLGGRPIKIHGTNVALKGEIKDVVVSIKYSETGVKQIEIDESNFNLEYSF